MCRTLIVNFAEFTSLWKRELIAFLFFFSLVCHGLFVLPFDVIVIKMKTCLYNFDSLKTPLLYSKTGVYSGIHYFSYFAKKHRLWVLIRTVSLRQF